MTFIFNVVWKEKRFLYVYFKKLYYNYTQKNLIRRSTLSSNLNQTVRITKVLETLHYNFFTIFSLYFPATVLILITETLIIFKRFCAINASRIYNNSSIFLWFLCLVVFFFVLLLVGIFERAFGAFARILMVSLKFSMRNLCPWTRWLFSPTI